MISKKLHSMDWRNFRKKKHWHGIHHYNKKFIKQHENLQTCIQNQELPFMGPIIKTGFEKNFLDVPNTRRRMRCKARYQTWEWYSNT